MCMPNEPSATRGATTYWYALAILGSGMDRHGPTGKILVRGALAMDRNYGDTAIVIQGDVPHH